MRVVSLVPSITETLRAWGRDPVACTRFCDQPDLPEVGGTKNPDLDAIDALRPDVVLMDRQENRREDADALVARGIHVVAVDVDGVGSLDAALTEIAAAVAATATALELPPELALDRVAFVPIWRRPWMTIGPATYGAAVLRRLGIDVWQPDPPARTAYPEIDLAEVIARRPDVVVAPTEPYDFRPDHLAELAGVAPVTVVDGRDLFWWGTRTPAAIARLAIALAP